MLSKKENQKVKDNYVFPWDQNPGEPSYAYKLFTVYKNLGRTRKCSKVCEVIESVSNTYVTKLSGQYRWRHRADQYDEYKDNELAVSLQDAILASKMRTFKLGEDLQKVAAEGSKMLSNNTGDLTAADVARLADIGTKIINLSLGSSTEIKESNVKSDVKVKVQVEKVPEEIIEKIGKEIASQESKRMVMNV